MSLSARAVSLLSADLEMDGFGAAEGIADSNLAWLDGGSCWTRNSGVICTTCCGSQPRAVRVSPSAQARFRKLMGARWCAQLQRAGQRRALAHVASRGALADTSALLAAGAPLGFTTAD